MSSHPLWTFQSIRDWLSVKSPKTARNYLYTFNRWLDWLRENEGLDVDADEIIEMRKQDLKSDDPKQVHRWEQVVRRYFAEMKREMSPWGAEYRKKTVQSFFKCNYLRLSFLPGDFSSAPQTVRMKQIPSQDDVKSLYEMAESWRDKAVLLLMYQTGMSPIDVSLRNVQDVPSASNPSRHVYFEYLRSKTGRKVRTCLSSEFLVALQNYLAVRPGNPDKGPLFMGRTGRRLTSIDVSNVVQSALEKTNVKSFQSKNLRDAYKDALRAGHIDADTQDWMMGHKGRTGKEYGQPDIVAAYENAWPFLRVTEQETVVAGEQEQRIQALEGEVAYLKESLVKIRDELREISQL